MATHSSVLAWRKPGTEGPSGLPSMGSHRVGHDWGDLAAAGAAAAASPRGDGDGGAFQGQETLLSWWVPYCGCILLAPLASPRTVQSACDVKRAEIPRSEKRIVGILVRIFFLFFNFDFHSYGSVDDLQYCLLLATSNMNLFNWYTDQFLLRIFSLIGCFRVLF